MSVREVAQTGLDVSRVRGTLIVATCCGSVALIIALTAGAISLTPVIGRDLGGTQSDLQWISDAYPVLLAALLLPAGAALDRFGRRRGMLLGCIVLIASLSWSGTAGSIDMIIASRCLAGVGAALIFPGTLATINAVLPPGRRPFAVGLWGLSMVGGAVVGLVMTALISEAYGWEAPFLVFGALAIVLLAATAAVVPETRADEPPGLDPVGSITSFLAVGAVALAVSEGPVRGWADPVTLGLAVLGVAMVVSFIGWERRHPRPLLEVGLLAEPRFGTASIALFVTFFAHFAMFFVAIQYMVFAADMGIVESALGVAPPAAGFLFIPFGPWVARRFGRRRALVVSLTVMIAGSITAIVLAGGVEPAWWVWLTTGFIVWAGLGIGMVPPTQMIIESVPESKQGVASAVNDLTRELGAAFGIAFGGSAFNTAYRAHLEGGIDGVPRAASEAVRSSPAAGQALLGDHPAVAAAVHDAVVAGWQWGFGVIIVVLVLGLAVVAARCPDD